MFRNLANDGTRMRAIVLTTDSGVALCVSGSDPLLGRVFGRFGWPLVVR